MKTLKTGLRLLPDGTQAGLHPSDVTPQTLKDLGHSKQPLSKAVRQNCIDCQGGSTVEVGRCTVTRCPLWPFRAGNPWRKPRTEAQRLASAANAKALHAHKLP